MTVAADTREAVREHPFLETALRAGVVNFTAAARFLVERDGGPSGDREAVAAALRRHAEELDGYAEPDRRASVSMRSGVAAWSAGDDGDARADVDPSADVDPNADEDVDAQDAEPLLTVGGRSFGGDGGAFTAVLAAGEVDAGCLSRVLERLRTAGVSVEAAGGAERGLAVVVDRRDGANAVRAVEDAL